jgi:hypothetical protein
MNTLKATFTFTLALVTCIGPISFAQKDYYQGYIVTNNADTLLGMVKDRKSSPLKIYKKIYYQNEKGRKKKYGPNEILAYKSGNSVFHSVWYDDLQFLRVMESGRVTYYIDESIDEDRNLFESKILKRENENKFTTFIGIGFRKKTMKYFADCPLLVEHLDARDFRYNSLGEAVRFYNQNCQGE